MPITCLVPTYNEELNITRVVHEILQVSSVSEIIIIDGNSSDRTYDICFELALKFPDKIKLLRQRGIGKFDALLMGAQYAQEKFIILWDADGTVPLESTQRLINKHLATNSTVIGDRLKGIRSAGSMPNLNYLGNWLFALAWMPIINFSPADTLCGTKIIRTEVFHAVPTFLRRFDSWGDLSLIATSRYYGHKVDVIAVNYQSRRYGLSKMNRWKTGFRLLLVTVYTYLWFLHSKKIPEIS
jgi:glycosyltransferase involved in cell wall biosynthesis